MQHPHKSFQKRNFDDDIDIKNIQGNKYFKRETKQQTKQMKQQKHEMLSVKKK